MTWLRNRARDGSWLWFVLRRRVRQKGHALQRLLIGPRLPVSPDGRVRIHLGCGDVNATGFINVDAWAAPHVHYVRDVTDLSIFPDGFADLVYACHVLEHVRHRMVTQTLWEWRRVLKPGGVLRLSVPDFERILHVYEACDGDLQSVVGFLMGGQQLPHDTHCSVFDRAYLSQKLVESGFREIRKWDAHHAEDHEMDDWASRQIERSGRWFDISLNLEAVK